jgi:hypothetical protein
VVVHDRNRFDEFLQINHIPTRAHLLSRIWFLERAVWRYRSTHGKEDR